MRLLFAKTHSAKLPAILIALLLLTAGCNRDQHPRGIGLPAHQFTLTDGTTSVNLANLRGHVVMLNFWASWCAPCIDELPSLLALHHQMPGLTIVAISIDEDASAYRTFLQQNNVDFLTVRDPNERINTLYGTVQIPETYIIDKQGILRRKFVSEQDWTSPAIVAYLRSLGA